VAVKITDWLSGGIGLDILTFSLKLQRDLPIPLIGIQGTTLKGDSVGVGFNLGFQVKPLDGLALGVSYRSQVRQDVRGSAVFSPATNLNSSASGTVILPDLIFTGISYQPIKSLSLEAGVVWTHWSLLKKLDIKFDNPLGTLSERKNWHNTLRPQFGVEYRALDWLALRFGYAYDQEPLPDEYADYLVPMVGGLHIFGFGAGFYWRAFTFDVSYNYVFSPDERVNNSKSVGVLPSVFQNRYLNIVAFSVSYKFF
jgi:long-chain fatty acid transport protein